MQNKIVSSENGSNNVDLPQKKNGLIAVLIVTRKSFQIHMIFVVKPVYSTRSATFAPQNANFIHCTMRKYQMFKEHF